MFPNEHLRFFNTNRCVNYTMYFPFMFTETNDISECMSYYSLDMNTDSNPEHHKTLNIAGNCNNETNSQMCVCYYIIQG